MSEVEHVPYSVASGRVHVRPYERDEHELLRTLRLRMLEDAPDAFTVTVEAERDKPLAWWRERLASTRSDRNRLALVAEVDGEPVGSVLGVVDAFDRKLAHLYALWVSPHARRKGAANALVGAIFTWARERGAKSIELSVTIGNHGALALYERNGFRDTGEREPLRPGSRLQLMHMRAPL
jgi:ribosomal protein S18 acetylase RimI-like enzyme